MPGWLEVLVLLGAAALVMVVAIVIAYCILGPSERDIDL